MPHISETQALPKDFKLEGYRIDRQISEGGFSFVYLAYDESGARVAIKEYLPARLVRRTQDNPVPIVCEENRIAFNRGMKSFFEEGRLLAHIKHPNIVQVLNFFRANETAYMVMRYEDGVSLSEHLLNMRQNSEQFDEATLRTLFVRLLSGLREVHLQKLLHLDIKPGNIYLRNDNQPVLLDFGATRQGLGEGDTSLAQIHTPGFAAPEQQGSGETLGPWTDIYSIGATLYACLSTDTPQAAGDRLQQDALEPAQKRWSKIYSPILLELIDWSMKLRASERPQSVFALQKVLNGELLDLVDPSWFD